MKGWFKTRKEFDGVPPRTRKRHLLAMALLAMAFLLTPMGSASANPVPIPGCEGDPAPIPETPVIGSDGVLVPPQSAASIARSSDGLPPDASLYGQYGTSGQRWHTIRESCIDKMGISAVTTLSNTAWDLSKTINQSTITVYEAATSDGLLDTFNDTVENVIHTLREGVWRPLVPAVIVLGALWLGWYGLIRKRVTLTFESTVWMILAVALGMWILAQPGQVLSLASTTVNAGSQLVNSAVGQVSIPGMTATCPAGAPEIERADWESESEFAVRQNSQMLWNGLVCQPWMAGQFGAGVTSESASRLHGVELLEAQGISRIEQQQIDEGEIDAATLMEEKQESYEEIASEIENTFPEVYPLFAGDLPWDRFGTATLALFASIFAGGLILAGSVALIVLKIGFLILLLLAPIFLLIGVHPGFGRVVLLRWIEMLLGLLLKQIFIVLLISLLVMAYGMIMSTGLGWGLQMILLSLFTLALFIYRKPFAHLFASVNANTFTSRMVSDALTSSVLSKSANILPPVAYARAQKWGLKRAPQLGAVAAGVPAGGAGAGAATPDGEAAKVGSVDSDTGANEALGSRSGSGRARGQAGYGRARSGAKPPPLFDGNGTRVSEVPSSGRSSSDAPKLSDVASASAGAGGSAPRSESIPPRPPGGWTGRGSAGWSDIFGPSGGSGGGGATSGGGGSASGDAPSSGGSAPASGGESPARPSSGWGILGGRRDEGNASRWGGGTGGGRKDRPAPPRRGGGGNRGGSGGTGGGGGEGSWFSSSGRGNNNDGASSPFWAQTESQRRRDDPKRNLPFWLRDEND